MEDHEMTSNNIIVLNWYGVIPLHVLGDWKFLRGLIWVSIAQWRMFSRFWKGLSQGKFQFLPSFFPNSRQLIVPLILPHFSDFWKCLFICSTSLTVSGSCSLAIISSDFLWLIVRSIRKAIRIVEHWGVREKKKEQVKITLGHHNLQQYFFQEMWRSKSQLLKGRQKQAR